MRKILSIFTEEDNSFFYTVAEEGCKESSWGGKITKNGSFYHLAFPSGLPWSIMPQYLTDGFFVSMSAIYIDTRGWLSVVDPPLVIISISFKTPFYRVVAEYIKK